FGPGWSRTGGRRSHGRDPSADLFPPVVEVPTSGQYQGHPDGSGDGLLERPRWSVGDRDRLRLVVQGAADPGDLRRVADAGAAHVGQLPDSHPAVGLALGGTDPAVPGTRVVEVDLPARGAVVPVVEAQRAPAEVGVVIDDGHLVVG